MKVQNKHIYEVWYPCISMCLTHVKVNDGEIGEMKRKCHYSHIERSFHINLSL